MDNFIDQNSDDYIEPVIKREKSRNDAVIFLDCLAKSYNIKPDEIVMREEGDYIYYLINDKIIFRDSK